jgi:predicted amidohydrolase YtcJ
VLIALSSAVFVSVLPAQTPSQPPADLVLRGGKIITLDSTDRVAQAIAVRANRIAAVGSDAEIQRLVGPSTRVIPLQGRGVAPGFIDSHTHVESTAEFRHF